MRARVGRVRGLAGEGECRRRCSAPQTEVCLRLVACIGSISAVGLVSVGIPSEVRVTEPWAGLIRSLQSSGAGCGRGEVPPCLGVNRGPL